MAEGNTPWNITGIWCASNWRNGEHDDGPRTTDDSTPSAVCGPSSVVNERSQQCPNLSTSND